MTKNTENQDAGLAALSLLLQLNELPTTADGLRRAIGQYEKFSMQDMVRAAETCQVKATILKSKPNKLASLPFPLIAELSQDEEEAFIVVLAFDIDKHQVLIRDPKESASKTMTIEEFTLLWSGNILLVKHSSAVKDSIDRFSFGRYGLNWFIPQLMKYKSAFANILMGSLLIQIFALVTPLFTMIVIDKVLTTSSLSTLDVLALGLAAIAIFDFLIGSLRSHLLGNLTNRIDAELVAGLFKHILKLPLHFFTGQRTGDTVSRVKEVEVIRNFFTGPSLTAVIDFPFTIVFLLVMYWFSPLLTFIVLGAIITLLVVYGVFGQIIRNKIRAKSNAAADNQSFLTESVSSIEMFKSLSVEPQMQRQWEDNVVENSQVSKETEQLNHNLTQASGFINKVTIALCLWMGAKAVLAGDMTAGQLIGFNMMISRVLAPAMRIAQLFQHIQQASVSMQRVSELFNAQPECKDFNPAKGLPNIKGDVRFENVSFTYSEDQQNVLEDITFDINAGEVVGIVGISGSGKSTLMRLLQRLYIPQKGRIFVDNINLSQIDPAWLRRQIGVVSQDNILLNRSVRENIAIASPGLPIETIEAASRLAGADKFIRELPDSYNTMVGERGSTLSMGQRQRLALARALVTNPRLLILDEATSSLDYEAERVIQSNMQSIVKGRTVFMIAHRLQTLAIADRIITIENGRISEDGDFETLMNSNGDFAKLHRKQLEVLKNRKIKRKVEPNKPVMS